MLPSLFPAPGPDGSFPAAVLDLEDLCCLEPLVKPSYGQEPVALLTPPPVLPQGLDTISQDLL